MILVDTNVFVAAADLSADEQAICAELLDRPEDYRLPATVAAETAWMLESRVGAHAEAEFVRSIADGDPKVIDLTADDWRRCSQLLDQYADLRLGLVDASIVAVAERLKVTTIATLNHRDFGVVRPKHVDAFTLAP